MVESSLESMINHNRDTLLKDCPECGTNDYVEKITTLKTTHFLCHNPECPQVMF